MSLRQVTFARDDDNAVTVLVLGAGGGSGGSGGGGASTFLQLTDTPAAYTGQGGRAVRVNAGATGLEFFDGGVGFSGAFADLSGKPTTLAGYGITDAAGLVHTHVIADVTGLQAALDAKAAGATVTALVATVNAQGDAISLLDTELDGKANLGHTHAIGDVTGLQAALDGKAATSHTHIIGNITGLQAALDGKAAASHTHAAADIVSGVLATARLGTGTPGSGNFLRGDGTWASLPGGSASWGAITGTLASQADLQAALDARLNASAVSAFGATLIDDADAAAARTTLGLAAIASTPSAANITSGTLDTARLPASALALAEIVLTVDGGGAATAAGERRRRIERDCTITSASIAADVSGSVSVTFKRDRGGTVVTLGTIALSAAQNVRDTTLSGWTASLLAGDILIGEYGAGTTVTVYSVSLGRSAA